MPVLENIVAHNHTTVREAISCVACKMAEELEGFLEVTGGYAKSIPLFKVCAVAHHPQDTSKFRVTLFVEEIKP